MQLPYLEQGKLSRSHSLFLYFLSPFLVIFPSLFFPYFLTPSPFLPSFSPSAWQGQLSAHGEQECSRRHLWKGALAANLSSSAIPGQGRLQGTSAVRRLTPEEGGGMRVERKGNEMQSMGKRKGQRKQIKLASLVLIIYSCFCQAKKKGNKWRWIRNRHQRKTMESREGGSRSGAERWERETLVAHRGEPIYKAPANGSSSCFRLKYVQDRISQSLKVLKFALEWHSYFIDQYA